MFDWPDNASGLLIYFLKRLNVSLNDGFYGDRSSEKLQSLLLGGQEAPGC